MVVTPLVIQWPDARLVQAGDRQRRELRRRPLVAHGADRSDRPSAALAIHTSQVIESSRVEERRKAILEERNRLARDIRQLPGFGAI